MLDLIKKNKKKCLIKSFSTSTIKKKFFHYGKEFSNTTELIHSLQEYSAHYTNTKIEISELNQNLLRLISDSQYTVFAWDPSNYSEDADTVFEIINEIVKGINDNSRAGVLLLSGDDGSNSMQSVMLWNTGLPLRTAFTKLGLRHQPFQYSTKKIIDDKTTDLILWISCFENKVPDFLSDIDCPLVVIGHHKIGLKLIDSNFSNYIFLPVATPGIDTDGYLCRCDNLVITPFKKILDSPNKSFQDLIHEVILIS